MEQEQFRLIELQVNHVNQLLASILSGLLTSPDSRQM